MDVEKTMQFILETQARLEASASLREERITKPENSVYTLTDLVGRLAQAEIRLVEKMDQLAVRMDQLAEAQAHTEQRVDALINAVDALIRREASSE
jgi:hypothetical protein